MLKITADQKLCGGKFNGDKSNSLQISKLDQNRTDLVYQCDSIPDLNHYVRLFTRMAGFIL